MSQTRPIINRNYNFESFTGALPDAFTVASATGPTLQLLRTDPREHPLRRVFPKKFKSSDYIFDGPGSFRWQAAAADSLTVDIVDLPVEPGMIVSVVFVYRVDQDLSSFSLVVNPKTAVGGSNLAVLVKPTDPPLQISATAASAERDVPGMPVKYNFRPTGQITFGLESNLYWTRYGTSFRIPSGAFALDLQIAADSVGATNFDLGEFRVEALDSLMLAQGR